jgi:hypothetical protein
VVTERSGSCLQFPINVLRYEELEASILAPGPEVQESKDLPDSSRSLTAEQQAKLREEAVKTRNVAFTLESSAQSLGRGAILLHCKHLT